MKRISAFFCLVFAFMGLAVFAHPAYSATISNPIIWADVPDVSIVAVGSKYYMSSTTMHMAPGVPIMESTDLVHWKTVSYANSILANIDALNLNNGKSAYGDGSWASSIRYKNGTFYVLVPSNTTGKTYLYSTQNVHTTPWKTVAVYNSLYHDPSLLLDDDGRNYIVSGAGDIKIVELTADLTAIKSGGTNQTLIANATAASGSTTGLAAEGTHIEKINGYYYVFNICWPSGSMRTELVFRSSTLTGTYTGQIALQNLGVAQGGIFQATDGTWWALLFKDSGSVGRAPWLVPVTWQNNWPIFGVSGKAPTTVTLSATQPDIGFGMVASDDFSSTASLLEWQWNHNPDSTHMSFTARPGYYRITTSRVDALITSARNTLTQRTFGPKSSAQIALDVSGIKDGDVAGLSAFQADYGYVGVKKSGTANTIVMVNASSGTASEIASVPLNQNRVYLRIDMDFTNQTDKASFFYSLDSTTWNSIGNTLQMSYTIPHFMGYRFGLFNYATKAAGGYADFDWFKIGSAYNNLIAISSSSIVASSSSSSTASLSSSSVSQSSSVNFSSSATVQVLLSPLQRETPASYEVFDMMGHVISRSTVMPIQVSTGCWIVQARRSDGSTIASWTITQK